MNFLCRKLAVYYCDCSDASCHAFFNIWHTTYPPFSWEKFSKHYSSHRNTIPHTFLTHSHIDTHTLSFWLHF